MADCPRCGLHFERESGYWVGAQAINFVVTGAAMIVFGGIIKAFTIPHVNIPLTLGVLIPLALIMPIFGYPFSKTLWMAIDRAYLQRMDQHERPDE